MFAPAGHRLPVTIALMKKQSLWFGEPCMPECPLLRRWNLKYHRVCLWLQGLSLASVEASSGQSANTPSRPSNAACALARGFDERQQG